MFTDEERKWIKIDSFGFPIKEGCPDRTRESIEMKKKLINEQKVGVSDAGSNRKG